MGGSLGHSLSVESSAKANLSELQKVEPGLEGLVHMVVKSHNITKY